MTTEFEQKIITKHITGQEFINLSKDRAKGAISMLKKGATLKNSLFDEFRDNQDVCLAAVKKSDLQFNWVSDRLKSSDEFIQKAIRQDGQFLRSAPAPYKNDKDFVLIAVQDSPKNIKYASPEIQQLCLGKDPVKAISSSIAYEKLQEQLKPKADIGQKQTIKI